MNIIKFSISKGKHPRVDSRFTDWDVLYTLSADQQLLPLVYDGSYPFHTPPTICKEQQKIWKKHAIQLATRQIVQTNEFLTLLLHAQAQGLDPVVVKGVTVRSLYPQPYLRPSVDEDLLIPAEDAVQWHQFLLSEGLFLDDPNTEEVNPASVGGKNLPVVDLKSTTELSYHRENSPTYIELHKTLFDPDSDAYGDFNALFPDVFSHTMRVQIEDVSVLTLEPGYHLLYLILHAFKHFVHSGIGIRAVCDIGMFAEHYRDEIDWSWIRESLERVNAFTFAGAMLRIVQKYLMPDAVFFSTVSDWDLQEIDVEPLLEDILASGVHGASSLTRLHSSNITLHAVSNQKKNQSATKGTLRRVLFPPAKNMVGRYPYLKKLPFLLPVAWLQRSVHYLAERKHDASADDMTASLRLGEQRIALLKKYDII